MTMLSTVQTQKAAFRKHMSKVLRLLDPLSIKEQSRAVASKVLQLPALQNCNNLSCFLSMPVGELDTSEIVAEILKSSNKSLFVPKITTDGAMEFLKLCNQNDLDTLPSGLWGIREPSNNWESRPRLNAMDVGLDVILVPGVVFDRSMSRLGHGKGYYDKYIARYIASGRPPPLLVALSLRDQLSEVAIPVGEHDWKMDMIVTPDEILDGVVVPKVP